MSKIITDLIKAKLTKRLSEYGDFYWDMLGQCASIDKDNLPKKKEYQKTHNDMTYYMIRKVEEFGKEWSASVQNQAQKAKDMKELQLKLNKLFIERREEWEAAKKSWEPALKAWLEEQWGKPITDSRGQIYQYGLGPDSLVLLKSQRYHTMQPFQGAVLELYVPLISVTDIGAK